MYIEIKLSKEQENKITEVTSERIGEAIDEMLLNDKELDELIKKTIWGQVKTEAIKYLQRNEMREKMAQKVCPIIYETLGLSAQDKQQGGEV